MATPAKTNSWITELPIQSSERVALGLLTCHLLPYVGDGTAQVHRQTRKENG
jgi:hypothetical protein